jgi:hypothetical protein
MWRKSFYLALLAVIFTTASFSQYVNVLRNGGFESGRPALFDAKGVSGAVLEWATDARRSADYSLKITKGATTQAVYWESQNMCTYWAPFIFKDKDLVLGGYVKTSNVNVNPQNDDQRFYIEFSFYDRNNNLIFGQPVRVYVPQTSSSVDWTRVENDVPVVLPDTAYKLIVKLVGGKDATGSVWFDDLFLYGRKTDGWDWVGSLFNNSFNANEGWFYWWKDFEIGTNQYIVATVSSEASHSGSKSLKLAEWDWDSDEVVWISDIYELPVKGKGKKYVLSAWVKIDSLIPDSLLNPSYAIGFTWTWHTKVVGPNTGWNEKRAEDYKFDLKFMKDQGLSRLGWTQFATVITVPDDDVVGVSVRARFWPLFYGKVFFDDFVLIPLPDNVVLRNGGFESGRPALFDAKGVSGAVLEWATDARRSADYSLKITKGATTQAVYWESQNMCTYWAPFIFKDKDLVLGGYVKTSNVNVNPQNDDQRFYIEFSFYDRNNNLIFGQPVKVYVPQTSSSVDWTRVENDVPVVLPDTAYKLIVKLVGGKDATGSVWFDDLFLYGRKTDGWDWVGSLFNNSFNANEGWFYWWKDFEIGTNQYIVATVSSEASYSGSKSLKLAEWDWDSDEVVWISDIYELPVKGKGKKYVLSAWVKIDSLIPDSLLNPSYAIGFTWTWHTKVVGPNTGWNEKRAEDYKFDLKFMKDQGLSRLGWTQFATVITVPDDDVVGVSVRARFWPLFYGKVFFDNFALAPISDIAVGVDDKIFVKDNIKPSRYELYQNYPNPFNPTTVIEYALPEAGQVKIEIYNLAGQKVRTLVDSYHEAGKYRIHWDGTDDNGARVSSGIYIYRLVSSGNVIARKMILLK